jgi:hypothetical protein
MQHNSVPTTCTASLITGWSIPGGNSKDPKEKVNAQLKAVNELIAGGFKTDFAIIHAFTTQNQVKGSGLDEFMPRCGFELLLRSEKKADDQRHKETGDLSLWAVTPNNYEACLTSFKKELTALKDKIDPPKKPDPARQKFPTLLHAQLRKNGIIQDNAAVDNVIASVLIVKPDVAWMFIKTTFGIDLKKWNSNGENWTRFSIRQLKIFQQQWKDELI